ncbi:hypothetical protein [Bradyrhizobium sp. GM2.2]|uniref:hypothetical protein n=1 Tax=Bradyrhizobium sp. GM2.2 TaxID=3156358 RepID=UPI00339AE8AF
MKLVTVFPKSGACGLPAFPRFTCCSTATGRPRAMIDGETLTNRRTAAASALASRHLSRPDSRTLLLIVTACSPPIWPLPIAQLGRLKPCWSGDAMRNVSKLSRTRLSVKRHPELPPLRHVELPPPSGL